MPELPQIESRGEVRPAGIVPVQGGEASEAVAKAGADVSEKAAAIQHQLISIDRYTQFHQADAEFVTGSAQNALDSRTIQDPEGRAAYVAKANANLTKQIVQKYPHAGIELGPQLAVRQAEANKQATDASIVLAHGNAVDNLATTTKTTSTAFANAQDDRDAQHILSNGHQLVDQYMLHGVISQGEAEKAHYDLEYGAHLAAFNRVADIDPVKAMDTPMGDLSWKYNGKDMGISPVDYLTVQSRAQRQENRKNDIAQDEFKQRTNKIDAAILDGSATDAEVAQGHHDGIVSTSMYEYHFHHAPFEPGVATGAISSLDNLVKTGASPEQIDQWQANYTKNIAPGAEPDTNKAVMAQLKVEREQAGHAEGRAKNTLIARAYHQIEAEHEDAFGPNPDYESRSAMNEEKRLVTTNIRGANSLEEAQDAFNKFMKDKGSTVATSDVPAHVIDKLSRLKIPVPPNSMGSR